MKISRVLCLEKIISDCDRFVKSEVSRKLSVLPGPGYLVDPGTSMGELDRKTKETYPRLPGCARRNHDDISTGQDLSQTIIARQVPLDFGR